jgi:hypothetical protein
MKSSIFLSAIAALATFAHGRLVEVPFGASNGNTLTLATLQLPNSKRDAVNASGTDNLLDPEPNIVHVTTNYDPNNIANDATWRKYVDKAELSIAF